MELLLKLFYSFIFISIGVVILKYRKQVKSWTGNFFWAERYLGRGGTYLILIFLGLLSIFIGIIYPFGGFEILFGKSAFDNGNNNYFNNK